MILSEQIKFTHIKDDTYSYFVELVDLTANKTLCYRLLVNYTLYGQLYIDEYVEFRNLDYKSNYTYFNNKKFIIFEKVYVNNVTKFIKKNRLTKLKMYDII